MNMKNIFSLLLVIASSTASFAQAQVRLVPGQSFVARSGEVVACDGGRRGNNPAPRSDVACLIHFENNAYHVYAESNYRGRTVLNYDYDFRRALEMHTARVLGGDCPRFNPSETRCVIRDVNGVHHLYMQYYNVQTTVGWSRDLFDMTRMIRDLQAQGLCP